MIINDATYNSNKSGASLPASPRDNVVQVVARRSPLSVKQVEEVFTILHDVDYHLEKMSSYGDVHLQMSLMESVPDDFFTRELDEKLIAHEADVAIHSAKDLPYPLPAGLDLVALTEAHDHSDSLVSRDGIGLRDLPAGARIGTSSKVRKAEILKLRMDLVIVPIRGTIEHRVSLVDNGEIDALVVATCALQRLGLAHRITERLPFCTHPLQGHLAVVARAGDENMRGLFAPIDVRRSYGKVTLVGFGPGNPELLTIGGDRAMWQADVIFHDDLTDAGFLAENYSAEKVYVGKRIGRHSYSQDEINEMLYQAAIGGKHVVRLKGGDPMVFARGREEIDYLESRFVEVRVIPGVTSAVAASAYTRIPLTHRGLSASVAFALGHNIELQVPDTETVVYYMGGHSLNDIASAWIDDNRDPETPVAIVMDVSLPTQRTIYTTIHEMKCAVMCTSSPVLIIVGAVVKLEKESIRKQQALVTGTKIEAYQRENKCIHTPLIKITECEHTDIHTSVLHEFSEFDTIVFTSRYGVSHFAKWWQEAGRNLDEVKNKKIVSVGSTTTAEISNYGWAVAYESGTESAEGISDYFVIACHSKQRILIPRSEIGIETLPRELLVAGHEIKVMPIYRNIRNEEAQIVDLTKISKIYFSSPSTVEAFEALYGRMPNDILMVAKGTTTQRRLQKAHVESNSNNRRE